jgi:hypothetical protein
MVCPALALPVEDMLVKGDGCQVLIFLAPNF